MMTTIVTVNPSPSSSPSSSFLSSLSALQPPPPCSLQLTFFSGRSGGHVRRNTFILDTTASPPQPSTVFREGWGRRSPSSRFPWVGPSPALLFFHFGRRRSPVPTDLGGAKPHPCCPSFILNRATAPSLLPLFPTNGGGNTSPPPRCP